MRKGKIIAERELKGEFKEKESTIYGVEEALEIARSISDEDDQA